jgi:hypothetical protein
MLHYAIALLAGLLVKTVDWLDDDVKSRNPVKYLLAAAYGVLIGFLVSQATFSVLFLGAILAQAFARKIDTLAHRLGFIVAAASLFFFGAPGIDLLLLGYFLVLAFLDEVDYVGRWRPLETYRPILQIGSLALVLIGRWDFVLAILAFDAGYLAVSALGKRFHSNKKRKSKN